MKFKAAGMDNLWLPSESDSTDRSANSSQIAVYITVGDVFPEVDSDLETLKVLLKELSRTDALIWCARLNLIISNSANHDEYGKQAYGIWNFFTREEAQRIQRFYSQHKGPPFIFFRGQLLELMRWISLCCNDLPGDGSTFNDPNTRRTFAKAALIASDLWGQRNFQDWYHDGEIAPVDRNRMLRSVRVAYESTNRGFDPIFSVGRGWSLFIDHLVRYSPSFLEDFRKAMGMKLEDYFGLMFIFASQYLNRTPDQVISGVDKSGIFLVNNLSQVTPELASLSSIYLETAAQSPDDLSQSLKTTHEVSGRDLLPNWSDFYGIRDRPILRTTDGRAIILDPVFFAENVIVGPFFKVLSERKDRGYQLFVDFGSAFESYANSILCHMYPQQPAPIENRLTCDLQGHEVGGSSVQIADACLNDVDDLVLFESKGIWIPDKETEGRDPLDYYRALFRKYAIDENGRPKGCGQLARAIDNLSAGKWLPANQDFSLAKRIFPVLLVHDAKLEGISHARILGEKFQEMLSPEEILPNGYLRKGRFIVSPLTILTIDTLEILERSIELFSLVQLLQEYSKECPDRMMSLRNYISASRFGKLLLGSSSLAESGLKASKVAHSLLGGNKDDLRDA